ncbi:MULTISPECIES: peroxiredoxin-like family protein [Cetobacterium]|uniref:peroxiredoxin-like family protein n=1 Tax=Cetobacterium TaxID=180162 RepID=UPI00210440E5|nr:MULTISPECIES: peroxiredoxin-like family protein [Cetobacterium]WVJ02967.1 peroxiredoxin-like family protein [Cetobacterium somerae]
MVNILEKKLSERRESAKNRISPEILSKMLEATQSLKNSELEKEAFNIGDKIEDTILLNNLGDKVSIMDVLGKQPAIISFYRGTWCPYCNLELSTYNELLKDKNKIKMIAISPERPESSINVENLNFEVLSDIDNKFAKKLNLTFDITETIENIYDGFGINLEKSQGKKSRILPIPATYIVDSSGVIVYAYIDVDYTKRAEPKDVIDKYLELIK